MSEEDKELQKHLIDEMMKVSKTNPDVMFYMEALMKKYEEFEQKVEQLENIRKEANKLCDEMLSILYHYNDRKVWEDMKDILNKESEDK